MCCGETAAPHECVDEITHKKIVVAENGRKANVLNPQEKVFRRIQVDGCLVNQETIADWIVSEVGVASVIVELKGSDVKKACRQLMATLKHQDCIPWLEEKIGFLVVCSRVPSFDTSIARAKLEARKQGVLLTIKCNKHECGMSDLV